MAFEDLYAKPGHLIHRCQQIAVSLFMEECRDFALTPIRYAVLPVMKVQPGIGQATLAARAALDRSTIGEVVARMAHRGLVDRRLGRQDRRRKVLRATPSALGLLRHAEASVRRARHRMLAPLGAAERRTFMRLLARLVDINNTLSRASQRPRPPGASATRLTRGRQQPAGRRFDVAR